MTARTLRTYEAAALRGDLHRRALLLLAALLVAFLTVAPRAEGFVYWTNNYGANNYGAIGRANLDGTWLYGSLIQGGGCDVAVDGTHIYWTNQGIGRANLNGTGADEDFIPSAYASACGLAVDGSHVYWAWFDLVGVARLAGGIGRANVNGTGIDEDFIAIPDTQPCGVAVDGTHIYWANRAFSLGGGPVGPYSIGRANLNGAGADEDFIPLDDVHPPCGVAVDGQHLYWASGGDPGSIGRANLNGTGADEDFIPLDGAYPPCAVAVDGQHLYWASQGDPGSIGRANLNGTGADADFIPNQVAPAPYCGVAVDALSGDFSFGKVKKNKSTGTAMLTVELPGPGKLDLAKTNKVKDDHVSAEHGGTAQLLLKPNEKTRKRLKAKGKAAVEAKVTFWVPRGGPYVVSKKINLVKRQGEQERSLRNNGATG